MWCVLACFFNKLKVPVTNSSLWSALWILPGLLTGILLLLNPDDHNVPQLQGALGSSQGLWLSHHGTKGSSLTTTSDSDRSKTEASKKNLSPRVHRLPGNVKWVRPHGMGWKNTLPLGKKSLAEMNHSFGRKWTIHLEGIAWSRRCATQLIMASSIALQTIAALAIAALCAEEVNITSQSRVSTITDLDFTTSHLFANQYHRDRAEIKYNKRDGAVSSNFSNSLHCYCARR